MTMFNQPQKAKPSIKGSTTIDHRICDSLNLSFIEYVILDYIEKHPGKIDLDRFQRSKGLVLSDHIFFVKILKLEGLIEGDEENLDFKVTKKWMQYFDTSKDFDEFWTIFKKNGNKAQAVKAYAKARKVVDKETLHNAAARYIKSKEGNPVFLHASTYLNPETRHWEDIVHVKNDQVAKGVFGGSIYQKKNPNARKE